jgi:hypothetical protein
MSIRKLAVNAAIVGLVALAGGVAPAAATTALRTDPGGALLTGTTTLRAASGGSFTSTSSFGMNGCSQASFDADVRSNTSATSITGTLTALSFTSCAGSFGVVTTFQGCSLDPDAPFPTIHLIAGAGGGTVTIGDVTVRCSLMGGSGFCYFTASSAVGSLANGPSTLTYTFVPFAPVSGTTSLGALCGDSGSWAWTFTHIVQGGTNRTVTVTTS